MFKVVETFSGIGAQAKALENIGCEHEIALTADWDINAIIAYYAIHKYSPLHNSKYEFISDETIEKFLSGLTLSADGQKPISKNSFCRLNKDIKRQLYIAIKETKNLVSITDIHGQDIPEDINLFTYSFPCQDLSLCGCWTGNKSGIARDAHNRSGMLWEVERILLEMFNSSQQMPEFLLMENVPNILSDRHIDDFNDWQNSLTKMGYYNHVYVLDARNFGGLQKRRRAYMISIHIGNNDEMSTKLMNFFKEHSLEEVRFNSKLSKKPHTLKQLLCTNYSNSKYRKEALSSMPNDTPSRRAIWSDNAHLLNDDFSPKNCLVECVTTKQDRNPNSGLIIMPKELIAPGKSFWRYLTPREALMLMGFDRNDYDKIIKLNLETRNKHYIYNNEKILKLAGNSIVVDVLEAIFTQILSIKSEILLS